MNHKYKLGDIVLKEKEIYLITSLDEFKPKYFGVPCYAKDVELIFKDSKWLNEKDLIKKKYKTLENYLRKEYIKYLEKTKANELEIWDKLIR